MNFSTNENGLKLIRARNVFFEQLSISEESEGYVNSVLYDIFDPFLKSMENKKSIIMSCSREKFMRKFNIKSNIADIFDDIHNKIISNQTTDADREYIKNNFVLFGGKLVDLCHNKNSEENDFDIWLTNSSEGAFNFPDEFELQSKNYKFYEFIYNGNKIQIMDSVNKKEETQVDVQIEEVLRSFDLRHCAIAMDYEKFYWIKGALRDIFEKKITINRIGPSNTIGLRINKYARRGFKIALPDVLLSSIMQLSSIRLASNDFQHELYTSRNYDITTLQDLSRQWYQEAPF